MRIGIDYTAAVRQGAGIGRYTRQLVQALLELDAENHYTLLAAAGGMHAPTLVEAMHRPNVRLVTLPISDRWLNALWHRLRLPLWVELASGRLDLFHSPDFVLPPILGARTLVTVHDLSFMRVPECSDPRLRGYLLRVVPRSVRRADWVLADSKATQKDVVELLQVDPTRVRVVYAGVDERFRRVTDPDVLARVRARYSLPERFVLGLGTLQPRKNYERLVEAWARMRAGIGADVRLVIAGGKGWLYEGIFRRVEELGLRDAVLFPGYVADEDLPALYSLADVLAFPSLYEGFGLPPLEAMACGTPVVASNASSLPEVVGDAALCVDPYDVPALADALQRLLTDAPLRADLVQRGLLRAQRFTWTAAANALLATYTRAAQGV